MQNDMIIKKHCFVKRANGKAYCMKCGEIIMQDRYNMNKHSVKDDFSSHDFVEIFRENLDFACAFSDLGDKVGFTVFTPRLDFRPGFQDRFIGGHWAPVYKCVFDIKGKRIVEKDGGLNDIHYWKKIKMKSLNLGGFQDTVRQLFHIPGVESLEALVNITIHRGYRYQPVLRDEDAKAILSREIDTHMRVYIDLSHYINKDGTIHGEVIDVNETKLLRLDVCMRNTNEEYRMLIGETYFYSDSQFDVKMLLKGDFHHKINSTHLEEFANSNPGFGLMNYWSVEGKKRNILIPLFSIFYDESLELLSKSGCAALANRLYDYREFEKYEKQSQIKNWLGVPVKYLRCVKDGAFYEEALIGVLKEVYERVPEYMPNGDITYGVLLFLKENVLAELNRRYTAIVGFSLLSKKLKIKMINYLADPNENRSYRTYVDYLNMSRHNGRYLHGYLPENLEMAHDQAHFRTRGFTCSSESFEKRVHSEEYKALESSYGDEAEMMKDDKFFIRAPHSVDEMYKESEQLHHCVRTYWQRVASGHTNIYFLRQKKNPDVAFGTIEVLNSRVVQLKANYNAHVSLEGQAFVKKWIGLKRLGIDYTDFDCGA